ncbi:TerD family protein [Alysiella filiformis]|uniref:Stress response protein SCP2 n=1 Tax=Alysiella filiformis DSM 16848 TaxID=1120981 RepID=A0A286E2G4_9NEIS|nr:TerD family protein [Alysiella filiformis]QMT30901.1 TerD family protein [Alysiella filiformis]UBQ56113.1 TerD family protein [Alysiella filiformis DSM 16848]SOD65096.1 Stress response protein SCP2 [Alysiella filiformis DSM 16848]
MAISLRKGQGVNLRKDTGFDLSRLSVGLSWEVINSQPEYDLDAIALVLDEQDKVRSLGKLNENGRPTLVGGDVVFYNSLVHPSGKIRLSGDNRTGSSHDMDDETIEVDLDSLPAQFHAIVFLVVIFKGKERGQSFAGVNRARILARDAKGREICRYEIGGNAENAQHCAMTFARAERDGQGGWVFRALGEFAQTDRFVDLLKANHMPY